MILNLFRDQINQDLRTAGTLHGSTLRNSCALSWCFRLRKPMLKISLQARYRLGRCWNEGSRQKVKMWVLKIEPCAGHIWHESGWAYHTGTEGNIYSHALCLLTQISKVTKLNMNCGPLYSSNNRRLDKVVKVLQRGKIIKLIFTMVRSTGLY